MKFINKMRKKEKGFTLVEIIVVLVILAILAAFTIPTMLGFVNDAKAKAHIAQAREVYVAAQAAATERVATFVGTTSADLLTGEELKGELEGTTDSTGAVTSTTTNASMIKMLGTDIPDASWTVVVDGDTQATGKVDSIALTIDENVITVTPGGAAVVTAEVTN